MWCRSGRRDRGRGAIVLSGAAAEISDLLGGREPNIRRVDLGDKGGIYYRAQVGSFATLEQANTFCGNLKDAGGQCIVQKN